MDLLREIAALAKEEGTAVAGWVCLLAGVAWIAGSGAKAAIRNVRSLLAMNEQLRDSMAKQLKESERARAEVEQVNHQLRGELEVMRVQFTELESRIKLADRLTVSLTTQLRHLTAENARLRAGNDAADLAQVAALDVKPVTFQP